MRAALLTGFTLAAVVAAGGCGDDAQRAEMREPPAASSGVSAGSSSSVRTSGLWRPRPGTGWQWQLTGTIDTSVDAPVYDVDLFTTSAATVAQLHADGRKVICYVNVGSAEDFRPDHRAFPPAVLGSSNGWPGERWLDIRRIDVLGPIMATRFDQCRQKGFDAVEPDNVDGYAHHSGFPLTAADQLAFNHHIAALAHARGLAVGLKNDLDQVSQLVSVFDFAVNEQCFRYRECALVTPFVTSGKAVFHVEYTGSTGSFCSQTRALGLSSLLKREGLDAWRETC
jgi:hypothetical protein